VTIAVTGANSSVGLSLLPHLARRGGTDVIACVRSNRARASLPLAPRIAPHVVSYDDRAGLSRALSGADCAVHLAGILIEWKGTSYETANIATAEAVARAAAEAGVGHLVLVSVLGAAIESTNRYYRTKGQAERVFCTSGVAATILRTPILLGPGTAGAAALVRTVRTGRARLLGGGTYTMCPLDVDDLNQAITSVCGLRPNGVVLHELVGPEPVTYRALVERAARIVGAEVSIGSMPIGLAKAGAWLRSRLQGGGVTPAVIDVITRDEVVERNADAELGLTLTPLDDTLNKIFRDSGAQ
jgi:uncharacterized protein YbjT (DUF2867 family)